MHILICSRVFPPAINPEALATRNLADCLITNSLRTTVLTVRGREVMNPGESTTSRYSVIECPSADHRFRSLSRNIGNWIMPEAAPCVEAVRLKISEVKAIGATHVYSRAYPSSSLEIGIFLSSRLSLPLTCHLSDPFPNSIAPIPYRRRDKIRGCLETILFRRVLKHSRSLTVPTEGIRKLIQAYSSDLHITCPPIYVVPHVLADCEATGHGPEATPGAPRTKDPRTLLFVHAGTIDQVRSADALLVAVAGLPAEIRCRIKIVFVGHRSTELPMRIAQLDLSSSCEALPHVSYPELNELYRLADVLLVLEGTLVDGPFLPSKFVDYLGQRKAIVALTEPTSTVGRIALKFGILSARPSDSSEIRQALGRMVADWELDSGLGSHRRGLMAAAECFCQRRVSDMVLRALTLGELPSDTV